MRGARIRVLVVDDSAFARKVVREVLSASPAIEVVGIARDGLDALEKIAELEPDVVTLDLVMPELDGLGVLAVLGERERAPRVVVVTMSDTESRLGVAALDAGAFDVVHKPTALATDRLYELGDELVTKVRYAAEARERPPRSAPAAAPALAPLASARSVVVVGGSTGGPRAITRLLAELPATLPVPLAVVVHMPPGYTEAFAERLDAAGPLRVLEARDGASLVGGSATIGRAGYHLKLLRAGDGVAASLEVGPLAVHRPSVDVLFESAAAAFGPRTLGVVLTGMGDDGLEGARAIRRAGGTILAEAASSCVVYGMPRAVVEAGLADAVVPLDEMARAVLARL
jgi:two-component system, chemotaxis family, protein-glutamate methylesterase/glutaminase